MGTGYRCLSILLISDLPAQPAYINNQISKEGTLEGFQQVCYDYLNWR